MKVVPFHSWGAFLGDPEDKVLQQIDKWIKKSGILIDPMKHQVYGFNNPEPKMTNSGEKIANKENPYGYECWITIPEGFELGESVKVKNIEGGFYGVISIRGLTDISKGWKQLVDWIQKSEEYDFHPNWEGLPKHYDEDYFKHGTTALEHHVNYPESEEKKLLIDIYIPIIEKS